MTDEVKLTIVREPREIRITLGEGGAPAQRTLHGVEFYRDADGNNVADKPYVLDVTAEEAAALIDSAAFAQTDQLNRTSALLAEARNECERRGKALQAQADLINHYETLEAEWNNRITPAIEAFRAAVAKI